MGWPEYATIAGVKKVKKKRENTPKMGYVQTAANLRSENEGGGRLGRQGLDVKCHPVGSPDSCHHSAPQTDWNQWQFWEVLNLKGSGCVGRLGLALQASPWSEKDHLGCLT